MLKVLQLIPTLDRSGAEKQMVLLAKRLPRDRFQVEVAGLTRLGPLESELRDAGIPVTAIGKRFKLDPIALLGLTRFLKSRSFDIVQTWIFAANTYGRVASRLAGVPLVIVTEMAVDLWKGRMSRLVDRRLCCMVRSIGRQLARRRRVLRADRRAQRKAGHDLLRCGRRAAS